jgi:uncharacterized coiled-coil protein SlyX
VCLDSWLEKMDKNPQSKDDALEALDFIVNVLKEHEKDLDKLINELATVTEQMGDSGELSGKVVKVEEKIDALQKQVTDLIGYFSRTSKETLPAAVAREQPKEVEPVTLDLTQNGPSVILRVSQWEDFQTLAMKAQTLSFNYKEQEKIFQADAIKGNKIFTYNGPLPKLSNILKMWLSKQLDISERNILEGLLTVG